MTIFLGAVGSNTDPNAAGLNYLPPQYYYPPQSDDMRYATCALTNIRGGFGNNVLMMDYIILATLAYTSPELTQPALDAWFGEGVVLDRTDIVEEFRSQNDPENSAVFFKLFTFPDIRLGVISVRGTSNNWDMLADSQLWSAAALMQGIRFILPAGEIWTPILNSKFHCQSRKKSIHPSSHTVSISIIKILSIGSIDFKANLLKKFHSTSSRLNSQTT